LERNKTANKKIAWVQFIIKKFEYYKSKTTINTQFYYFFENKDNELFLLSYLKVCLDLIKTT